jgi:hypothetical protein
VFERLGKLIRLLDLLDAYPEATEIDALMQRYQAVEQRLNLLESQGAPSQNPELLAELGRSLEGTIRLLQQLREGQGRQDAARRELQDRVEKLELLLRSSAVKDA